MQMDWDQVRFFLALSRCGTLLTSASRLGVNQTTVSRRIQTLEKDLATPLFTRDGGLYTLTESGRRLLQHAEQIESSFVGIERDILGAGTQIAGIVRLGATEGFGTRVLTPLLAELTNTHEHLRIDLLAVPRIVNLSRREADIVITLDRPARGPYHSTKLTDYALGLYGAPAYLDAHAAISDIASLAKHKFISYIDDLLFSKELQYLSDLCDSQQIVLRSTSILAQLEATAASVGLAILPLFLAQSDARLRRILPNDITLTRTFWMSTSTDIQNVSRMRATWTFLRDACATKEAGLMGIT